ncbi:unnamed protein product, partial [Amoebophrya sp. A120]|eukprot:GSA120T00009666001.1
MSTTTTTQNFAQNDNYKPIASFWNHQLRKQINKKIQYPFELDDFQKRAIYRVELNQNVFVAAHTSAGKTVVAEYAIANALFDRKIAIYTSPIKALSNQKFREFKEKFPGRKIGIVTGDVSLNPDADVLIVTTEILRSVLYKHAELRAAAIGTVIFDEIHYLNDYERGVVWEEVIILLPKQIPLVFLSATVSNVEQFGDWVGRLKKKKLYYVSTNFRPTPLEHKLFHKGESYDLLLPLNNSNNAGDTTPTPVNAQQNQQQVMENSMANKKGAGKKQGQAAKAKAAPGAKAKKDSTSTGTSAETSKKPAEGDNKDDDSIIGYTVEKVNQSDFTKPAAKLGIEKNVKSSSSGAGGTSTSSNTNNQKNTKNPYQKQENESQQLQILLTKLKQEDKLPATVFVFSRKKCVQVQVQLANSNLEIMANAAAAGAGHLHTTTTTPAAVHIFDEMPHIQLMQSLALRGIGFHHSGLLPITKEITEILFSQGLLKVLFATETFAMGVNMPARSVIFTQIEKHDGQEFRYLKPSEYTQMAGRAGRRGLDDRGHVYVLAANDLPDKRELSLMMLSKVNPLKSQFRVTYKMLLSCMSA